MRCAIYARYSSDLQRESSIDDQIRKCREYAGLKGWLVLDGYIRSDNAVSGAALAARDALNSLIADAMGRPRPFDRILVDDTSRLARHLADSLTIVERLQFRGVGVVFVSQGIDSLEKTARPLLALNGMMDEQALVGIADKVHRGQEGRVLKGLNPGGKCFGYINVPIEDPTRQGKYGRPAILGVELRIRPEQAAVVIRIFRMYADGYGLARIAKILNDERVPAPQPPRTRVMLLPAGGDVMQMVARDGIEKHYTSSFPLTEFSCIRLHESPRTRPETYRSQSILQVNLRSKLLLQWRPRSIEPWPRWPRKACLQEPRPQHAYPDRLSPGTLLISEDNAKRNHLAGFLMARRS